MEASCLSSAVTIIEQFLLLSRSQYIRRRCLAQTTIPDLFQLQTLTPKCALSVVPAPAAPASFRRLWG